MQDAEWDGVTLRSDYREEHVAKRDGLADAARDGNWPYVLEAVTGSGMVNSTRVGGPSGYAPLHQAAWHGVRPDIAQRLLDLGAWRTLRTSDGERPVDIAVRKGHLLLAEVIRPRSEEDLSELEHQLHELIRHRIPDLVTEHALRLPQIHVLTELTNPCLRFPVPGLYGGFSIELTGRELIVKSWCRVAGGWAQTHRVTSEGYELIESGWDL
ncbi:ankyrin repeat domain-containing protein [Kutzneria viridogrisea]|uniref:Uncharacterized protein n=2 Tax=Kutzneria TaxID=43356 RepID=W5WNZ4_9PSEU|nr:ankyrin repeat domain-containing protein [Kutzneria albida]AHH99894.1 hypothetical protein KALB_6535 [Kutzneria albida DSM 43870]MBA8925075.1 hypothetical protein [Kutzneria viridogrisea]